MRILDFLRPELVVPNLTGKDKREVLTEMAAHLAGHVRGLDQELLLRVLLDRERLASTAIGEGVAIPHGKLSAAPRLLACFGRSPGGVAFESMDGRPTHLFFTLIAPESSTGEHLRALARISRLFRDAEFRQRLMQAGSASEIYGTIADEDAKH